MATTFQSSISPQVKVGAIIEQKSASFDESTRTVKSVVTAEVADSDGEVVLASGLDWSQFKRNPVVLLMHDPYTVIGKSRWQVKQQNGQTAEIAAETYFANTPSGEEIFTLYKEGCMKGFSIGMHWPSIVKREITPTEYAKNPLWGGAKTLITSAKVLEYSCVSLPACPDALTQAADKGLIKHTMRVFEPYLLRKKARIRVVDEKPKGITVREMRQLVALHEGRL